MDRTILRLTEENKILTKRNFDLQVQAACNDRIISAFRDVCKIWEKRHKNNTKIFNKVLKDSIGVKTLIDHYKKL